jgi:hypothetical protein
VSEIRKAVYRQPLDEVVTAQPATDAAETAATAAA